MSINSFLSQLENKLTLLNTDLSKLSAQEQYNLLVKHTAGVIKPKLLLERLHQAKITRRKLRVKYGIDPTAKDIHLGHIVPIIIARRLVNMGHKVILLFGDFTALVGDPTGRVTTRPILSSSQIAVNVADYKTQVGKFINLSKIEIAYNSPFYKKMSIKDLMQLYRVNKLQPLLQRDDFRNRAEGLTIAEALYPTLMAIDSVHLKPDIELGGKDQFLNFEITNDILRSQGIPEECAITTELLLGTNGDGTKMSKSKGNYISLRDSAVNIFGKIMSMPDSLMRHYFLLLTDITDDEWKQLADWMNRNELNPMVVKKLLARVLITIIHSHKDALDAQAEFEKTFTKSDLPTNIPVHSVKRIQSDQPWVHLLVGIKLVNSNREAREHIANGALKIYTNGDWNKVPSINSPLPNEKRITIKLGKRQFATIKLVD